jgi:hypothetical protein
VAAVVAVLRVAVAEVEIHVVKNKNIFNL